MEDTKYETGEVITTYVYHKDKPTELMGTYEYNTSGLMILWLSITAVVGIVGYVLGKKLGIRRSMRWSIVNF